MSLKYQAEEEISFEMFNDGNHELWSCFGKSGAQGFEAVRDRLVEERMTEISQRNEIECMEYDREYV